MRVLVLFDLPSTTLTQQKEYRHFRKFLIKNGFIMLQESVYTKLALNQTAVTAIIENVKKNKPLEGLVFLLTITEKQYNSMEFVVGEKHSEVIDSDERFIII